MTDQSLARFTRPHEPDTTELVLSRGERLPAHVVRRAMEALQVVTAYLQGPTGSFISVRPQPALAREAITEYLEKLLNVEVPGRSDPETVAVRFTVADVEKRAADILNEPFGSATDVGEGRAVADPTDVYSSPREQVKPTRRFDKEGAPY